MKTEIFNFVIPAKAGIQAFYESLDPGFRRDDGFKTRSKK